MKCSQDAPLAYKEELLAQDNNILLKKKDEQKRLFDHYAGLANTIENLEQRGIYYTRDWVYSTKRRKMKSSEDTQAMEVY
jgi:hypothetical protein